jgi:poly(3-hydroxybutyrate) depolymerase
MSQSGCFTDVSRLALIAAAFAAGCGAEQESPIADAAAERDASSGGSDHADASAPAIDGAASDDAALGHGDPSGGEGGAYPGDTRRVVEVGGGEVSYELYIPTAYAPDIALPMLALFHGQGGDGAGIRAFWRDLAEEHDLILMATTSTGASGGWSGATDIGRFAAALEDALGAYNIDRDRLYAWGFSAGGHFVHGIALANADTFAAYAVSAGVLDAFAGAGAPAGASRRIPVQVHIGVDDPLHPAAQQDRNRFIAAGWSEGQDLGFVAFDGGHVLLPEHRAVIWQFLERWASPAQAPAP